MNQNSNPQWNGNGETHPKRRSKTLTDIEAEFFFGDKFVFRRVFYKILSRSTALFLQDVIDLLTACQTDESFILDGELYYLCPANFLYNSVSEWTNEEQKYHLKALRQKGFVKTTLRGCPPQRWLSVDYYAIGQAVIEADQKRTDNQIGGKSTQSV
jgi:hypothetical protein